MRGMRHFLAALLTAALLLSLAACGSTNSAGQLRLYYPAELSTKSRSTGGGDAMAAALAACITRGDPLRECARQAVGAGALACTSEETIHSGMSWENINYILNKEEL